jgi:hypothetical protein
MANRKIPVPAVNRTPVIQYVASQLTAHVEQIQFKYIYSFHSFMRKVQAFNIRDAFCR